MSDQTDPRRSLQCMEVWGGNQAIRSGLGMAGLEAFVLSRPMEGTRGGDVYYLSSCASGRVSRMLLADVAGHGEAVGGLAESLRDLLRRYVNWIDQRRFVEDVNRAFTAQQKEGIFATSIAATWFAPAQSMWISSAGHPMPMRYRAREGSWRMLPPPPSEAGARRAQKGDRALQNLPLGVESPTQYGATGIRLEPGDVLVFYTDAVIEARDARGRYFGMERLQAVLETSEERSPATITARIEEALRKHTGRDAPDDDLTVLVVRRTEADETLLPVNERKRFPRLFIRAMLDRLRGHPTPIPWPQWSVANIGGAFVERLNRVGLPPVNDDDDEGAP